MSDISTPPKKEMKVAQFSGFVAEKMLGIVWCFFFLGGDDKEQHEQIYNQQITHIHHQLTSFYMTNKVMILGNQLSI